MKYKITALIFSLLLAGCFEREQMPPAAEAEAEPVTSATPLPKPAALPEKRQIPAADCRNLRPAADIDDLVRQIYDNLDSPCLFEQSSQALADRWGVYNVDMADIGAIPFRADGMAEIDGATAQKLEQKFMQDLRWSETAVGLALEWGKSESRGSHDPQPRVLRYFRIGMSRLYEEKYGGYGGSFTSGGLPDFLRRSGKFFENQRVYRWFNRQRSADLPYMEITVDPKTDKIESIYVYEKVANPQSQIHLM